MQRRWRPARGSLAAILTRRVIECRGLLGLEVIDTTVGSLAAAVVGSSELSVTSSLPEGLEAVTLAILITLPLSTAG